MVILLAATTGATILIKYPNVTEIDDSGRDDTPYVIGANNIDDYLLMTQHEIPEFSSSIILPIFFTLALLAVIVYKRKRALYVTLLVFFPARQYYALPSCDI
jgi:hypothetical protein